MGEECQLALWPNQRIDAAFDLREDHSEGVREEQAEAVIQFPSWCEYCGSG
jgi:hypothetical protein